MELFGGRTTSGRCRAVTPPSKSQEPSTRARADRAKLRKLRSPKASQPGARVKAANSTRAPIHHPSRLPESRAGPKPPAVFFSFARGHSRSSHDAAQPHLLRLTSTTTTLRQRRVHARSHYSLQRRQCRCYRRHEASVRWRGRTLIWRATSQEAESPPSATSHATHGAHSRAHERGVWRRKQGLLRPSATARNCSTMQSYWIRQRAARGAGDVSGHG